MSIEIRAMTEEDLEKLLDQHRRLCPDLEVKENIKEALKDYVERRIEPGGFLYAVLSNDLKGAFARADSYNRASLFQILQFCWMEIPATCWGSVEKVEAWLSNEERAE